MKLNIRKIKKIIKALSNNSRCNAEITYDQAKEVLRKNQNSILLDVRSPQEYQEFHLPSSYLLPLYELQSKIKEVANKDQIIIIYCQSGGRSKKALEILNNLGYVNLYTLEGGLDEI